jgi:DNA-binding NarL/FixJ family response regulator
MYASDKGSGAAAMPAISATASSTHDVRMASRLASQGQTNAEIGAQLVLSPRTVILLSEWNMDSLDIRGVD